MSNIVYTIGHSTHSAQQFIALLLRHDITAVADVRSSPYSRFSPQFNREAIKTTLNEAGIEYIFLGDELGARSKDRCCYVNGKVRYDLLASTPLFQRGLERIAQGAQKDRIAMMCAEKDPLKCHRAILVSRHLVARGVAVQHILGGGALESHDHAIARLLHELGLPDRDLFRSRDDLIDEAYGRRGDGIAYTKEAPLHEWEESGVER